MITIKVYFSFTKGKNKLLKKGCDFNENAIGQAAKVLK